MISALEVPFRSQYRKPSRRRGALISRITGVGRVFFKKVCSEMAAIRSPHMQVNTEVMRPAPSTAKV